MAQSSQGSLDAVLCAVGLHRRPQLVRELRAAPLPTGVETVLRLAGGQIDELAAGVQLTGETATELQTAARFFVEQILLAKSTGKDARRVLGLSPDDDANVARVHHACLQRLVHPDRDQEWAGLYAQRVNRAWRTWRREQGASSEGMEIGQSQGGDDDWGEASAEASAGAVLPANLLAAPEVRSAPPIMEPPKLARSIRPLAELESDAARQVGRDPEWQPETDATTGRSRQALGAVFAAVVIVAVSLWVSDRPLPVDLGQHQTASDQRNSPADEPSAPGAMVETDASPVSAGLEVPSERGLADALEISEASADGNIAPTDRFARALPVAANGVAQEQTQAHTEADGHVVAESRTDAPAAAPRLAHASPLSGGIEAGRASPRLARTPGLAAATQAERQDAAIPIAGPQQSLQPKVDEEPPTTLVAAVEPAVLPEQLPTSRRLSDPAPEIKLAPAALVAAPIGTAFTVIPSPTTDPNPAPTGPAGAAQKSASGLRLELEARLRAALARRDLGAVLAMFAKSEHAPGGRVPESAQALSQLFASSRANLQMQSLVWKPGCDGVIGVGRMTPGADQADPHDKAPWRIQVCASAAEDQPLALRSLEISR